MKTLFLTSAVSFVAKDIPRWLEKPANQYKLVFITTASEAEKGDLWWQRDDRKGLVDAGFQVFDYTLTGKTKKDVQETMTKADIIFVEGGNSYYLLDKAQQSGFLEICRNEVLNKGKLYMGCSAGSWLAGPDIELSHTLDDKIKGRNLKSTKALNLTDLVVMPHWGSQDFKDLYLSERIKLAYQEKYKIILINNYQYVRVIDEMYQIVEAKH